MTPTFARPRQSVREVLHGGFVAAVIGALMCGSNLPGLMRALRRAAEDPAAVASELFGVVLGLLLLGYGAVAFRRGLAAVPGYRGPRPTR